MGYFQGGTQDTSMLRSGIGRAEDYYQRILAGGEQPGAREMAATQAFQDAIARLQGQTAGQGGQAGAMSAARTAAMAPVLAQKQAQQVGIAQAGDVEAQRAAELGAMGQLTAEQRALFEALERQRQERGKFRTGVATGLLDVGTKLASGGLG